MNSGNRVSRPESAEPGLNETSQETEIFGVMKATTMSPQCRIGAKGTILQETLVGHKGKAMSRDLPALSSTGPMSPGMIEAKAIIKKTSLTVQTQENLLKGKYPVKENLKTRTPHSNLALGSRTNK